MRLRKNIGLIITHLIFWVIISSIPYHFNAIFFGSTIAIIRIIPPVLYIALLTYSNVYWFIPLIFRRKNLFWYTPFLAYLVLIPFSILVLEHIFAFINEQTHVTINVIFEAWQNGKLINFGKDTDGFPQSVIGLIVLLALFGSTIYGLAREMIRRNQQEVLLKAENLKNELKLLRSQMNPHFLFNAMNNLYAIVQLKPEKAGEFVLKLSDMLRYVTYDCHEEKVDLNKEVDYINNYIYFQKWRDQSFQNIHIDINKNLRHLKIEPMLLMPFVENAFKHSYDENNPTRSINLQLNYENNSLIFEIKNSLSSANTKEEAPDEYMGIGIENVQKRLELLYKNKYSLDIQKTERHFHIKLSIQIQ